MRFIERVFKECCPTVLCELACDIPGPSPKTIYIVFFFYQIRKIPSMLVIIIDITSLKGACRLPIPCSLIKQYHITLQPNLTKQTNIYLIQPILTTYIQLSLAFQANIYQAQNNPAGYPVPSITQPFRMLYRTNHAGYHKQTRN